MAKKKETGEPKPRYVYKVVRAIQPMWDGIELREPGAEFVYRVPVAFPQREEELTPDGTVKRTGDWKRDAQGKVVYYDVDDSDVYEIVADAPQEEAEYLAAILADPVVLLPDHQRPPEDAKRRPAPSTRGVAAVAAATDGGVL